MTPDNQFLTSRLLSDEIKRVLHTLSTREERIIKLRFGIDGPAHTLQEIGDIFSLTRERIRQIEAKALRKLRHRTRSQQLRPFIEGVY